MNIVVVGAAGFVGTRVAQQLADRAGVHVRWVAHARPLPAICSPEDTLWGMDLSRDEGWDKVMVGADALLHLGHLITGSGSQLHEVNEVGCLRLAGAASRHGTRVVALSTAAVYGRGPWRGEDIHDLAEDPRSPVSLSRARGDHHLLVVGATVLRPHLVLGAGDRWVMPRAVALTRTIGWIAGPAALHSVIHVDDLASLLIEHALTSRNESGIRLATTATTTLTDQIAKQLCNDATQPATVSREQAVALIEQRPEQERARLRHDFRLLTTDHYLTCVHGHLRPVTH